MLVRFVNNLPTWNALLKMQCFDIILLAQVDACTANLASNWDQLWCDICFNVLCYNDTSKQKMV